MLQKVALHWIKLQTTSVLNRTSYSSHSYHSSPPKDVFFLSKCNYIINTVCEESSPRQRVNSKFQDKKGGRFHDRKRWKTGSIRMQETIISDTWFLLGTGDESMNNSKDSCRGYITSFSNSLNLYISHPSQWRNCKQIHRSRMSPKSLFSKNSP